MLSSKSFHTCLVWFSGIKLWFILPLVQFVWVGVNKITELKFGAKQSDRDLFEEVILIRAQPIYIGLPTLLADISLLQINRCYRNCPMVNVNV